MRRVLFWLGFCTFAATTLEGLEFGGLLWWAGIIGSAFAVAVIDTELWDRS